MDCTEPDVDVGAPDDPRDKSSINSQPQDIDEARDIDNSLTKDEAQDSGKSSIKSDAQDIDKSSTNGKAQDIGNISTKDESQDIDKKTPVNDEAEQICHNVSVPLFTAK